MRSLWGHVRGVTALGVWHSTHLLSGSHDTKIRVWDLSRDCKCVAQLEGHRVTVWSIESDPHTPTVFSGAGDGYIKVWRIDDTPRCEATLQHGDGKVRRTVCYKGGPVCGTKCAACLVRCTACCGRAASPIRAVNHCSTRARIRRSSSGTSRRTLLCTPGLRTKTASGASSRWALTPL